ncbi:diphthamide biosynthesis enzyme Dph2 [Candidatus Micrarchaeota archaeon]|nr:diphthamide biosynthesis enzyme Dph2 [Candidatus Micrarchaeota archaeon]
MRIILQFPEGLKQQALEYVKKYEKEGHEVFIASAPCYGACDLCLDEARWVKAEKIIHFGHAPFVKKKLPIEVEYVEYYIDFPLEKLKNLLLPLEPYKRIAITTTTQYANKIEEIKNFFKENGKIPVTEKGYWAINEGQILGCDASSVKKLEGKFDVVIFIGEGDFHPLAIDTDKSIFTIHPQTGVVRVFTGQIEKLKKKRKGSILKAIHSNTFGILLSTKVGQFNLKIAQWAKSELDKRGKNALVLVANELEPLPTNNFLIFDCYVNTACLRIADDTEEFGKPIVNIDMLREVFKVWDELAKNQKG